MKTFMLHCAALACAGTVQAVTLSGAEWFLDADPGEGSGTSIAGVSGGSAALDVTVPAATLNVLTEGVHLLGLRSQDSDGRWGQVVWRPFVNRHPLGGLVAAEWFLDADPGEGAGTPIPGITGSTAALDHLIPAATINALDEGAHLLGTRFQDGKGDWSQAVWRVFLNQHPHGGLVLGEYFFNHDPGLGLATALSGVSGPAHDLDHTVSVSSFPAGANLLGVRLQDGDGEWGQTVFRVFLNPEVGSRVLNRVEYTVYRNDAPISSGSLLGDGSLAMNLTHPPGGVIPVVGESLLLEMQVVDDSGRRSQKVFRVVEVKEFTQSFLDLFFTEAEQADSQIVGDEVDLDGDGLANIVEQAMGLHPWQSDAVGATGLASGPGGMKFSFRSAAESVFDSGTSTFTLDDLRFEVEVSTDFSAWSRAISPADYSVSVDSGASGDGSFTHVIDLVNAGQEKRFYRLRVIQLPE